ncbi:hypothetical protein J2S57_006687 [Kineosporia succinea]|uniref:Uncharacterized protein n=1 Tax=Kineosporia succinea TaxID=84632 RepID=A0ABT9PDY5_9ACTN|nr:hypothetical protein [Kineosporia succinea]
MLDIARGEQLETAHPVLEQELVALTESVARSKNWPA